MKRLTQNGAFMFGSMIGDEAIESALVIPGDTDGTLVVERWMTKNGTPIQEPDLTFPDITGEWTIDDRKVVENGTITDEGPLSGEWMSYSNQTGKFVTATQHTGDTDTSQDKQSSVLFRTPDEAYLTNTDASLVLYHIIDNSTMEAVVNQKDGKSILYLDVLKKNEITEFLRLFPFFTGSFTMQNAHCSVSGRVLLAGFINSNELIELVGGILLAQPDAWIVSLQPSVGLSNKKKKCG